MSKLGDLTGSNKQDARAINNALGSLMGDDSYTTVDYTKIPLNQICLRHTNYYIDDIKKFKALKTDISKNGLHQPIVVVNIEKYLENCKDKAEKEYLKSQKAKGCNFFISSGHRRFKAYCALYLNKNLILKEDFDEMYKNFGAPKFDIKYSEIVCEILKADAVEKDIYNGTNLTNRGPSNFEFVVSCIENTDYNPEDRGYLSKVHDYIYENYGNSISVSTISDYARIFKNFSDELLECILTGQLPIRTAQKMLPVYDKVASDKNALQDIKAGKFKVEKYTKKAKKTRSVTYSPSDVLDILYKIKRDPKKLEEYIKQIEQQ